MKERKLEIYLFFILLGIALFLSFKIFQPYLYSLIVAAIFAVIFFPIHKEILSLMPKRSFLSALLTVIMVGLLVLLPVVFFGIKISEEIKEIYLSTFNSPGKGVLETVTNSANALIGYFSPNGNNLITFDVNDVREYAFSIILWLRTHFTDIFSGLAKFFVNFFLFLFAFFYFLKDGERFRKDIIIASPFKDDRDELIISKLKVAVLSVVRGSIFVALIQGVVSGIGYLIFGLPSPMLWGGVTALAALVPGLGTSLVIIPAVIYLFVTGATGGALGLILWGLLAVSLIDNFLGPKFIEKVINIHPLIILFGALGGISFFGPIGFLLGPITISFLYALFDIYKNIIVKDDMVK